MLHTSLLGRCGACVLRASLLNDSVCTISSLRPQPGLADPRARQGLWGAGCGADKTGKREVVAHGVRSMKRCRGAVLCLKLGLIEQAAQHVQTQAPAQGLPAGSPTSAVTSTPAPCMLDLLLRAAWCTCRARAWRSSRNSFSPPAGPEAPGGAVEGLEGFSRSGLCTHSKRRHAGVRVGTPWRCCARRLGQGSRTRGSHAGGNCHCILLGHSLVRVTPALDDALAVAELQHLLLPVVLGGCALAQAHHALPMDRCGCTVRNRQRTQHMLSDKHARVEPAGERQRELLLSGVCRCCC